MNDLMKNFVVWALIAVAVLVLFSQFVPRATPAAEVSYSTFLNEVRSGRIDAVVLQGDTSPAPAKIPPSSSSTTPRPTTPR